MEDQHYYIQTKRQDFYSKCKAIANKKCQDKFDLDWDDFGDTNSLWDYIDEELTEEELDEAIEEAVIDRVSGND